MTSPQAACLSGQRPVNLTTSDSCNLGFLCSNTTAETPLTYCPPTPECLGIRTQPFRNICPVPQGPYEPIVCSPGFYCPRGGREQIRCPSGHYCPQGTYDPIQCMSLSPCPEGSVREIPLIGIVCLVGVYLLLIVLASLAKKWKRGVTWKDFRTRLTTKSARESDLEADVGDTVSGELPSACREEKTALGEDPYVSHTDGLFEPLTKGRKLEELGLELDFHELQYKLDDVAHPILQGISGKIRRGCVFGIMGPSGAGKSTLIHILAGRIRQTSGSTAVNGVERGSSRLKHLVGFVPQDDIVLEYLTVRESILHSARIRLGGIWSGDRINLHVDRLIAYLGLAHVKDQTVGSVEKRGVSGGERKRVSIALELIAMPMALILDEPTSGLDATAALSIMKLLTSISALGITIVCAIHQPRGEVFELLDDILLLVSGSPAYLGEAARAKEHFEALGCPFPVGCNPADVVMDIMSDWPVVSQSPISLSSHPKCQPTRLATIPEHSKACDPSQAAQAFAALEQVSVEQKAPWYRQVLLYILCGLIQQRRQVFSFIVEMVTGTLAGLLIGLAVQERDGHLFQGNFRQPFGLLSSAVDYIVVPTLGLLSSMGICLAAAPAGIRTLSEEKLIFYREVHAGHSSSAYFLGKDVCAWPRMFISSLHFTTFYMILATPVVPFHVMFLLNAVYFFCIYGLAALVASFVRRQDALLLAMLASLIASILCGYGPRLFHVKSWNMAWLWYICPGTWYSEAFFSEHTTPFTYLYDVDAAATYTGYSTGRTPFDLGILIVIGVVYRLIAYLAMMIPTVDFSFLRKMSIKKAK